MTRPLPSSPNWYCSKVVAVIDDEIVAYGARSDINILQLSAVKSSLAAARELNGGIKQQDDSKGNSVNDDPKSHTRSGDGSVAKSSSTNGPGTGTGTGSSVFEVTKESLFSDNQALNGFGTVENGSNCKTTTGNDVALITTLSRLHREKITTILLLKHSSADKVPLEGALPERMYSLFSGAEDGKIKHHHLIWSGSSFEGYRKIKSQLKSEHQLPQNVKF